jgi:4-hydroxymandelate oxidase
MAGRSVRRVRFRTLRDLEAAARRSVRPDVWGYIAGGAGDERTIRANADAFAQWRLRPDPRAEIGSVDLRTKLLGLEVSAPFFVAPMAYQRTIHPGGERATAAAAASLGLLGIYSTLSSASLEAIARSAGAGPRWFQLYLQPDRARSLELVRRAERAGYAAIVVTIDAPVLGFRDRQALSGFALRRWPAVGNGPGVSSPPRGPVWEGGPYRLERRQASAWADIAAVGRATSLPLVIKGVLTAEAARHAVRAGAKAVLVSNHGGRQLDLASPALEALPAIVDAVGRRTEVYLDGGVRRGSDALVALALGARAVGLGRPVLWALACGGRPGVVRYLRLFGTELANSMLLAGRPSLASIDRSLLAPAPGGPGAAADAAAGRR